MGQEGCGLDAAAVVDTSRRCHTWKGIRSSHDSKSPGILDNGLVHMYVAGAGAAAAGVEGDNLDHHVLESLYVSMLTEGTVCRSSCL